MKIAVAQGAGSIWSFTEFRVYAASEPPKGGTPTKLSHYRAQSLFDELGCCATLIQLV
jgi:hypothetical protein